jgi:T5orf172 domain
MNLYDILDSVYILGEYENGVLNNRFKIGYSGGKTANRTKQYRAGNSRPVREIYTVLVPNGTGRAVENQIHQKFWSCHIPTDGGGVEWFELSQDQLKDVLLYMFQFESRNDVLVPSFAFDETASLEARVKFCDTPAFNAPIIKTDPFKEYQAVGGFLDKYHFSGLIRPLTFKSRTPI